MWMHAAMSIQAYTQRKPLADSELSYLLSVWMHSAMSLQAYIREKLLADGFKLTLC